MSEMRRVEFTFANKYCKISKISVQKGLAIILKIYYIRNGKAREAATLR